MHRWNIYIRTTVLVRYGMVHVCATDCQGSFDLMQLVSYDWLWFQPKGPRRMKASIPFCVCEFRSRSHCSTLSFCVRCTYNTDQHLSLLESNESNRTECTYIAKTQLKLGCSPKRFAMMRTPRTHTHTHTRIHALTNHKNEFNSSTAKRLWRHLQTYH